MTTPKQSPAASRKARLMYAPEEKLGQSYVPTYAREVTTGMSPVFVLPATPEAVEEMREAVAHTLAIEDGLTEFGWAQLFEAEKETYVRSASAAISALGLTYPSKKSK